MRAVLIDALRCLAGLGSPVGERRRLASQARAWMTKREACPFSFEYVCEVLDLDPEKVRRRLLAGARESCAEIVLLLRRGERGPCVADAHPRVA